jgi:hypothetical protein
MHNGLHLCLCITSIEALADSGGVSHQFLFSEGTVSARMQHET